MISSIVLAAGFSSRMGEPKALLDWGGEELVNWQVRQLREAGVDEVIVVLGYQADPVRRRMRLADCRVMLNPRYQMGRAGSLRIGVKAVNRDADSIVIMNVDQPRSAATLKAILSAHQSSSLVSRPTHDGHHGHPIVVSGRLREELLAAKEENHGLDGVLKTHPEEIVDIPSDESCAVEFNTPEEYQAALRFFGVRSGS
jgi:CTP:molybdopterin cytidylyltransferase MocA